MVFRLRALPPGRQLRVRRSALGLRQREVAALVGVSESWICRMERDGPGATPSLLGRVDQALQQVETERRRGGSAGAPVPAPPYAAAPAGPGGGS